MQLDVGRKEGGGVPDELDELKSMKMSDRDSQVIDNSHSFLLLLIVF